MRAWHSRRRSVGWCRPALLLSALLALAGCGHSGGGPGLRAGGYNSPGPPGDPWGPYVSEASARFRVPERWIREVMHQESGGHEYLHGAPVTSDAGAMGLMQVMPATYAVLRERYGLGGDAYDPHDNILAGSAYIREMYERYGSPGFLAAYNAGPARVDDYLAGSGSLPNETINYLASIAPRLGDDPPMTGPLAAFASPEGGSAPVRFASFNAPVLPPPGATLQRPDGCFYDPDAAYDPAAPCRAAPERGPLPAPVPFNGVAAAATPAAVASAPCLRDPDAAYDPSAPCVARPPQRLATAEPSTGGWGHDDARTVPAGTPGRIPAAPAYAPPRRPTLFAQAQAEPRPGFAAPGLAVSGGSGPWAIQVGAFVTPGEAERAAVRARFIQASLLAPSSVMVGRTTRPDGQTLYRARLLGLDPQTAAQACGSLVRSGWQCAEIPPGG